MREFQNSDVAGHFNTYPPPIRRKLIFLRDLIFKTALETDGVGPLEESLKWGEPAYLTSKSGSGSTVRIDWKKAKPEQYAMYFHCQTNLVGTFRELFPAQFRYEGNRAIVFGLDEGLPVAELKACISMALTYHLDKRRGQKKPSQNHRPCG